MKKKSPITYLCILSFIGFIYCIANDSLHCFLFMSSPISVENMNDGLRIVLEQWEEQGFIYNEYYQNQLVKVYGARIAFDVLAKIIDQEIKKIIDGQYERAKAILKKHEDKLHKLANKLLETRSCNKL